MKINVGFASYVTVIEFKEFMGTDVNKYKEEFEKWYFEEILVNNIPLYHHQSKYKYFNAQPIVDWMNEVAPDCHAKIIEKHIESGMEDTSLPYICF